MMIGEVLPPEPAAASKSDVPRVQYTTDQYTAAHRVVAIADDSTYRTRIGTRPNILHSFFTQS